MPEPSPGPSALGLALGQAFEKLFEPRGKRLGLQRPIHLPQAFADAIKLVPTDPRLIFYPFVGKS